MSSSQSWLSPDVEAQKQQEDNWQETPADNATSTKNTVPAASAKSETAAPKKQGRGCMFWVHLFLGVVFSILFIVAAAVQFNDATLSIMWGTFYIVQAILAILGTMRFVMCKRMLTKPILFAGFAILVWSLVLLSLAAVDLSKTNKGSSREEIGLELGGSILGCLSCIYFICMCMCCDKAPATDAGN